MAMLSPRLLVLGRRPRHDLHLLCCHLAIGLSRPVGEDVMIRQMLEAAGDAVILLDIVVDDIRGLQDEGQLLHLAGPGRVQYHDQNQCLQVCHREISFLLEIFRHRPAFFRGPQVFVPPQGHQQPRAPMPPGHPWPQPPRQQFRPRPEPAPRAPPAPRPRQTPTPGPARDTRPAQNKGPRRPAVPKTPPQQKTADELLDNLLKAQEEERRGQAASSSARFQDVSDAAPNPAEVEKVFEAVYQASTLELERQLGIVDACNTFSGENPLTPLQAYMAFVLRYRINPRGDSWLIPKHAEMREVQDRQRAAFKWARSWTSISQSEIDEVILDLFALFPADEPAPKSISGLTLRTFAQSLLSAKVSVKEHFVSAASYNVPNVNSCMYFFKVKDFPGPPPTPGQAYAWAHCSDQKGTVGILSMGRVLRTAAYTLGLSEDQEAMSFFGRVHTNPTWTDNFVEWCANLTWSTKNSSGIVFGGYLSGNVSKSPSANTQLESSLCRLHPAVHSISRDKRWAIRECAARIDFICVVADSASADFPSPRCCRGLLMR